MLFNSPLFLFLFLPIFLLSYFFAGEKYRNIVGLIASIFFYAWGEPKFIFVIFASAILDWHLGNRLFHSSRITIRKAILLISVFLNVGILFYFKYSYFFVVNLNRVFVKMNLQPISFMKVALPLAVSFIVFEKITYTVDIFKGKGRPAEKISSYLFYVFLFPKLLAGPIVKYHDITDQFDSRSNSLDDVTTGLIRFSFGLAKKVLIADSLATVVDNIFSLSATDLGFYNAWIGAIFFALQIYFDFSGYSDMAIGICRIMGFRILENFNMPYISSNFTEFWRRWHISLSTWIKDYLYIPLGGSRKSRPRVYFNLWFCFLISGLWHGANWTFLLWGMYHGIFLIMDRIFWQDLQKKLPKIFNISITFLLLVIGWVIFRSQNIDQAWFYLRALCNPMLNDGKLIYMTNDIKFFAIFGFILSFIPFTQTYNNFRNYFMQISWKGDIEIVGALVLCIISIGKISTMTFNPFLYFRF